MTRIRFPWRLLPILMAGVAFQAAGSAYGQLTVDGNATKTTFGIKQAFAEAARQAGKSTVRILVQSPPESPRPAAYGTVITSDGYILTKGSEVLNFKKVFVKLPGKPADTAPNLVEAKIVGSREAYDLAMLKIDAKNLVPVVLADTSPPTVPAAAPRVGRGFGMTRRGANFIDGPIPTVATAPAPPTGAVAITVGEFVITPEAAGSEGNDLAPKAYGVISVARRPVPFSSGVLGVSLRDVPTGGVGVTKIFEQSGAGKAGVKVDDVITAVDGAAVATMDQLRSRIGRHRPTDVVMLSITRGTESLTIYVQLGDTILATQEDKDLAELSGKTNLRSSDFEAVLQHDTVLVPADMGGPLVDLEGHVIGINIARAGRTETFAIPADLLSERWLETMKDGTFAPKPRQSAP
jgi:serine protease Do